MVTWQIKNVISPLLQDLCTPNLGVQWLWMGESHPQSHVTHQTPDHVATQRRYISTFLKPMDPKLSRILVALWYSYWLYLRQRFTQKEIVWFKYQLISILLSSKSITYLMLTKPSGHNGKLVLAKNKRKNAY